MDIPPGERRYVVTDTFASGGRRRPLHDSAARAPPREGGQELRDAARRHAEVADLHPRLGFQLAGRLPIRASRVPSRRHDHHVRIRLRQLRGEPSQPSSSAAPRDLRPAHDRRDGGTLAAGGDAQSGGPRRGWCARHANESCARRSSASRRGSRPIPTTRRCTTMSRCCMRRRVTSIGRRNTLLRRSVSGRTPPLPTTTSATRSSGRGARPRRSSSLRQALALDPDYALAHDGLGVALYSAGQLGEATEHYRRAVATGSAQCGRARSPGDRASTAAGHQSEPEVIKRELADARATARAEADVRR